MAEPIGRRRWAIAEGFIPQPGTATRPALMSHETACILNAGDAPAQAELALMTTLAFGSD